MWRVIVGVLVKGPPGPQQYRVLVVQLCLAVWPRRAPLAAGMGWSRHQVRWAPAVGAVRNPKACHCGSGQPVPDRSPNNALTANAEGLPMHTSLTRPVHPPVAPVVGRRHTRHLFHHLLEDPPVVEQSHNRRRNTIYVLIHRFLTMKNKGSLSLDLLLSMVNNRRIKT